MKAKELIVLICVYLTCSLWNRAMAQERISAVIKQRIIEMSVNGNLKEKKYLQLLSQVPRESVMSDQCVVELYQMFSMTDDELEKSLATLQIDGSWSDINYLDKKRSGWEVKEHAERVLSLCKAYYLKKSSNQKTDALAKAIHLSMNYWFKHQFRCPNWWYNEIGIPRTFGPAFLLFEKEMSTEEKKKAVKVMSMSRFGRTGQNKIWQAGNVLMRALLQDDDKLVCAARDTICSETLIGKPEGIKPDWSFHQHGPQQQFGNYGLAYLCNLSFYARLFTDTPLALSAAQLDILTSLLLEGYQWITWKGYMDVNALNRQLFHNADIHKVFSLIFAAFNLEQACTPERQQAIQAFIKRNISRKEKNDFCGTKHFDFSDYTIHRTPRWMASVRMASERVIGTELINEDNLKGYYMADGALYTYVRGDEYHNIFPFWDWRRIPGITTYESNAPIPNPNKTDSRNHSSCVGGVTYQNTGITAMQLKRNKLKANKTWVFTDDYVLCMGSDIHADSTATIMTSIDQRFCKGKVWTADNKRFFHDNTGYIILQADTCIALTENKEGQWKDFMGMYKPEILKSNLFSIYLKHRRDMPASYAYLTLPATTQQKVREFDTASIHVIRNDKEAQAVVIKDLCYISVYHSTQILIEGQNPIVISEPGIYIVHTKKGDFVAHRPFNRK